MGNKMLIDATHPEETRVVVLKGKRVEEFDLEAQGRQQLRGNIYLAKVTRVEPSLQAAFVDYGGNRHGFLAFSEIHPDYYQIPYADRAALIAEAEADAAADAAESEEPPSRSKRRARRVRGEDREAADDGEDREAADDGEADQAATDPEADAGEGDTPDEDDQGDPGGSQEAASQDEAEPDAAAQKAPASRGRGRTRRRRTVAASAAKGAQLVEEVDPNGQPATDDVEQVGAEDALEEVPVRQPARRRQYKIQEVIRRRQILLVQVVKEERGTKGAALTTYLSLAGRYCVLMPNTARGGGISRKITNAADRRRLKAIASALDVAKGTGVIVRTAGANRTKAEIKRDFEYLLRLWESIRELTLKSIAPSLIYEEGNLIKRSIRDLYNKDIDEVLVEGEDGYREAKSFMRMLMPSHARNVKNYKEEQPLFIAHRVESQLDEMFSPVVTLKSGGYLVINQTEALVAIDVNSGKATREHNIEDTALQTNLEAAAEVARQLRLRDLAGLIVIDFIDMEERRNNRAVERKLKECLKTDRARIQVGRISHFGLLEMSRQRIRASVLEGTMEPCPHCQGVGRVRSVGSTALQIVRALEEHAIAGGRNLTIRTTTEIALYMLNQKRAHISEIERRFGIEIGVSVDTALRGASYVIERGAPSERRGRVEEAAVQIDSAYGAAEAADEEEEEAAPEIAEGVADQEAGAQAKRRRRRRGGRRRAGEDADLREAEAVEESVQAAEETTAGESVAETQDEDGDAGEGKPRRRRGRRGGRRRRRGGEDALATDGGAAVGEERAPQVATGEAPFADAAAPSGGEPRLGAKLTGLLAPIAWPWGVAKAAPSNGGEEPVPGEAADIDRPAADEAAVLEAEPAPADWAPLIPEPQESNEPDQSVAADVAREPAAPAAMPLPTNGAEPAGDVAEVTADADGEAEMAAQTAEAPAAEGPEEPPRRGWWQRRFAPRS